MKFPHKIGVLLATALLVGCVDTPKPMYNWDKYQSVVYQYYKSDDTSPMQQIGELKESIEKSNASNQQVPPGLHAHLGMLYANTGHIDLAMAEFNTEKTKFPESAPFMNYLTSKNKDTFK
jgi:hypothetical protein